jgi:hypothetical protein
MIEMLIKERNIFELIDARTKDKDVSPIASNFFLIPGCLHCPPHIKRLTRYNLLDNF